jgi:hypothetical protein
MKILRTPDERFEGLPGWDWEPQYYLSAWRPNISHACPTLNDVAVSVPVRRRCWLRSASAGFDMSTGSLFDAEVRIAYYDLGPKDAVETLLLTHGEPSWSYLYRKMIRPLLSQGYRLVLFDQVRRRATAQTGGRLAFPARSSSLMHGPPWLPAGWLRAQ